jgi:nucleotidyltransferase substrate binding protein (TIGR01987 family)
MNLEDVAYLDLKKAHASFVEIVGKPKTEVTRDATILRFEYTFEMSWKLMKRILAQEHRLEAFSPKMAFRRAAQVELIDDPEPWLRYHELRNVLVHTYKESGMDEIYEKVKDFAPLVGDFVKRVEKELSE